MHRLENGGQGDFPGMTGRACGGCESRHFLQELSANNASEVDMESIRQPLFGMTVEHDPVTKALLNLLPEEITELSYLALITRQVGLRDLAGLPQSYGEDDVFGTSTTPRFMPGTVDQWF